MATQPDNNQGFTLVELLVVIAIISLLSSVVLASISGVRESARDTRRIQDVKNIIRAIENYRTDTGKLPGSGDSSGTQIAPGCSNDLNSDLAGGGYLPTMPKDPSQSTKECYGRSDNDSEPDLENSEFFYGWDSGHCCEGSYCISINQLETDGAIDTLANSYPDRYNNLNNGVQYVTGGGDANIGTGADFNYCFVDQT